MDIRYQDISFVDPSPIAFRFYGMLYERSGRKDVAQFILFGIPFMGAVLAIFIPFSESIVSQMLAALAILVGFSINGAILMAQTPSHTTQSSDERKVILNAKVNALYSLVVGLGALIVAISVYILLKSSVLNPTGVIITSAVLYFVLIHYAVVIISLITRIAVLADSGVFEK